MQSIKFRPTAILDRAANLVNLTKADSKAGTELIKDRYTRLAKEFANKADSPARAGDMPQIIQMVLDRTKFFLEL